MQLCGKTHPQAWGVQDRDSFRSLVPRHVSYQPDQGTLWTFTLRDVPRPLRAKLAVLRLFACYMQRRVREVRAQSVGRRGEVGATQGALTQHVPTGGDCGHACGTCLY